MVSMSTVPRIKQRTRTLDAAFALALVFILPQSGLAFTSSPIALTSSPSASRSLLVAVPQCGHTVRNHRETIFFQTRPHPSIAGSVCAQAEKAAGAAPNGRRDALLLALSLAIAVPLPARSAGTDPVTMPSVPKAGGRMTSLFQGAPGFGKADFEFLSLRATRSVLRIVK